MGRSFKPVVLPVRTEQVLSQHREVGVHWVHQIFPVRLLVLPEQAVDPHGGVDPYGVLQRGTTVWTGWHHRQHCLVVVTEAAAGADPLAGGAGHQVQDGLLGHSYCGQQARPVGPLQPLLLVQKIQV